MTSKRRRLFVDVQVQGALLARTVLYWTFCLVALMLMLICWRIATGQPKPLVTELVTFWKEFSPAIVISLLLLPLVVWDSVRLSNRFAGPMYRLRRSIRQLADGEPTQQLFFREGDFWKAVANDFNRLAQRVETLEAQAENRSHRESGEFRTLPR